MQARRSLKPVIATAVIANLAVFCCIAMLGKWIMDQSLSGHSYSRYAVYERMRFEINRSEYFRFLTDAKTGEIAHIYITSDSSPTALYLPSLTEEQVKELWPDAESKLLAGEVVYYRGSISSAFGFTNGRLMSCTLHACRDTKIGASKSGEFIALPGKASEVQRMFGKPVRYETVPASRT